MRIVGIDQSTTSTGIAIIDDGSYITDVIASKARPKEPLTDKAERIARLANHVVNYFGGHADLIVIERPALRETNQGTSLLSGLYWMILAAIRTHGDIPVAIIDITQLKKYATGSGATRGVNKIEKRHVIAAAIERYAPLFPLTDDEADALTMAAMGARHLGHPIERADIPSACVAVLDGVVWPKVTAGNATTLRRKPKSGTMAGMAGNVTDTEAEATS